MVRKETACPSANVSNLSPKKLSKKRPKKHPKKRRKNPEKNCTSFLVTKWSEFKPKSPCKKFRQPRCKGTNKCENTFFSTRMQEISTAPLPTLWTGARIRGHCGMAAGWPHAKSNARIQVGAMAKLNVGAKEEKPWQKHGRETTSITKKLRMEI